MKKMQFVYKQIKQQMIAKNNKTFRTFDVLVLQQKLLYIIPNRVV